MTKDVLTKIEKILLNTPEALEKFGSARLIFMNEENENEWKNLSDDIKTSLLSNVERYTREMTHGASIQVLSHVINDLSKKICELEKEVKEIRIQFNLNKSVD